MIESFIKNNSPQLIQSFVEVLQLLSDQLKGFNFILMFDQFESGSKASIDFLRDLSIKMPDKFHLIVSCKKEEKWSDTVDKELHQYITNIIDQLIKKNKVKIQVLNLEGLSDESIIKWIEIVRGKMR